MRALRLAKVAAQAEGLRLRRLARRQTTRGVYGAIAAFFAICVLVALHVAGALALTPLVGPIWAALIVAGVDLVIAGIFGAMASSSKPDRIEEEAYDVRKRALVQMQEAASVGFLVGPALRLIGTRKVYGVALAALTARYLGGRR